MENIRILITAISSVGVSEFTPPNLLRKIHLTNLFAFTLCLLVGGTAIFLLALDPQHQNLYVIRILLGMIYLLPLFFNWLGWHQTARFSILMSPSIMFMLMAFLWGASPATSLKIGLMPTMILPVLLFGIDEMRRMLIGIGWIFVSIFAVDRISENIPLREGIPADIFNNVREINVTIIISLFMFILAFVLYQILLSRAEELIKNEHNRAEVLLKNILPEEIIPILKESPEVIAQHFKGTSILFADIANFTPLAVRLSPQEIVKILNEVFSHFDQIAGRLGLEKIKTIGDCYMVAAGVPKARDDHAKVLVKAALEFQRYINQTTFAGEKLTLRAGISSGPVIAGVIGRKKFIYDLWGDTVNTASRMESHGKIGFVQITEETYQLIKDDFDCEQLKDIHIKGKGEMSIYIVKGEKLKYDENGNIINEWDQFVNNSSN